MRKVVTILGTRPEIIRLSRIISVFEKNFDHKLIHTGQNFDPTLSKIFFDDLEIRSPDYYLDCKNDETSLAISSVIEKTYFVLKELKPSAVFILGDTDSAISCLAAKRLKIPIFHFEAGNRCFDFNVPEEINRKIVDTISDVNLCYSNIAKQNLLNEGKSMDLTFRVGSPMLEVLNYYKQKISKSDILTKLSLDKNKYFVLSTHRSENVDCADKLNHLLEAMNVVLEKYKMPVIFPIHPRTKKRLEENVVKLGNLDNFKLIAPLSFTDYIALQINAVCTFSDSGTITEESSILEFNALNLRDTTERQEGFESSGPIMVGFNKERIISSLSYLFENQIQKSEMSPDYAQTDVSHRIYKIVQSYIDYVNKNVWKKHI